MQRFTDAQKGAMLLSNDADFRRRCPCPAVHLGKRLEFDEAARPRIEGHGFQILAVRKFAFGHRLAEVLTVVADIKFVFLDGAVLAVVLSRQIGEPFDGGRSRPDLTC